MPGTQATSMTEHAFCMYKGLGSNAVQISKGWEAGVLSSTANFLHSLRMPFQPLFKVGTVFVHTIYIGKRLLT